MKLRTERRRDEAHHLGIETIDEDNHRAHGCDQQLIPAERLLVDELTDVEYGCLSHLPASPRVGTRLMMSFSFSRQEWSMIRSPIWRLNSRRVVNGFTKKTGSS